MADLSSTRSVAVRKVGERPSSSLLTDWIVIIVAIWFLGGLYLDGWAHNNLSSSLESFFTPWHAAFYSGFLAVASYHIWLTGIEALFSPTHLLLATGIALIVAGPMRSTSFRLRTETADWRTLFPLILSMTFLLSLFTFMAQFAYLFTDPWVIRGHRPGNESGMRQMLGILAALLHSSLLMGVVLPVLRRWRLPAGTLTFMLTVNVALMGWMRDELMFVATAVFAGVLGDMLLLWLRPTPQRPNQFHLFAFLLPFILYALYVVTVKITADSWWSIHMLAGLPTLAGISGFLLSYLVLPPESFQLTNSHSN